MNCKQGDLAFVVGPLYNKTNLGKVVQCIKFRPLVILNFPTGDYYVRNVWEIEPPLVGWDGKDSRLVPDYTLKPIRDPGDDARDETLGWQPVPGLVCEYVKKKEKA